MTKGISGTGKRAGKGEPFIAEKVAFRNRPRALLI